MSNQKGGSNDIITSQGRRRAYIEIICLLGKHPPEWFESVGTGREGVIAGLKNVDARMVLYDELLNNAQSAYADYLEQHVKVDKLWGVFEAIDDFTPPPKP